MMFPVFCERHATTVLLGSADVIGVTNSPDGPQLHWECYCGQTGLLSGRPTKVVSESLDPLVDAQRGPASPAGPRR